MAPLVLMNAHCEATPPAPAGKIVVSRLGPGESRILSLLPAVKLVIEGEEIHEIDGRPYVLQPGQLLFVDRGEPYRAIVRRHVATLGLCLYLPSSAVMAGPAFTLLGRALLHATSSDRLGIRLSDYAGRLHRGEGADADAGPMLAEVQIELEALLSAAASRMARLDVQKLSTRREVFRRLECARAFLHAHVGRPVPLHELAGVAGLSGFHLARYFSSAFGMPPGRYHRQLRLIHAADLLRRGEASVTEVAERAGYCELSAFSHAFRRQFGEPPSAMVRAAAAE